MRRILRKLPEAAILAVGAILVLWGAHSFFRGLPLEPPPDGHPTMPLCAPTIAELLGIDSASHRLQGLFVAGVGGVAICFAWASLRRREEAP
jgi:hypothetical protein